MRIKRFNYPDGTPKTRREILSDGAYRVETFVDNHPLAATLIACGTVHVAAYTALHYATRPPKNTTTTTTTD